MYALQQALSAALKTERRLPAAASFIQRKRQVRLAYPHRPRVVRLWNVSIRSAGQQPSRAEHGKWKVDIAELFAKVTLWRDRPESFFRQEIWASYIRFVATLLIRL